MGVLSTIGKLAGMVVGGIPGTLISAGATLLDSDKEDKGSDGKPGLVAKPKAPNAFKSREVKPFAADSFAKDRKDADSRGAAGAVSATKGVSPSQMEANYWSAIFADAKRKSEVK